MKLIVLSAGEWHMTTLAEFLADNREGLDKDDAYNTAC